MLVLALAANYDQLSQLLRPVAVATFSGEINGAAFELNGTIQHGRAQLKKLHPEVNFGKRETDAKVLGTRNKNGLTCVDYVNGPLQGALGNTIQTCGGMLDAPGLGRIDCPANTCVSMCCINGENIWLCNYNNYAIQPAPAYLASYANDIQNDCAEFWTDDGIWIAGGEERDSDGYAVIVLGWNGQPGHSC